MCLPCCLCLPPRATLSLSLSFLFLFYLYLTPFLSLKNTTTQGIFNCSCKKSPTPPYPDRDTPTYSLGSEPWSKGSPAVLCSQSDLPSTANVPSRFLNCLL